MTVSLVVVCDYERVSNVDVCRSTCLHLHRFRDQVLFWQVWRHECAHFAIQLETFRDGYELKAKRCDECKHMEANCERFDDPIIAPIPRASDPGDWVASRNVRQLPRAVERPTGPIRPASLLRKAEI
jgi:hypothetical protein